MLGQLSVLDDVAEMMPVCRFGAVNPEANGLAFQCYSTEAPLGK